MVGQASYADVEIEYVLTALLDKKRNINIQKEFATKFGRPLTLNQIRYLKNKYGKDPKFNYPLVNKRRPVVSTSRRSRDGNRAVASSSTSVPREQESDELPSFDFNAPVQHLNDTNSSAGLRVPSVRRTAQHLQHHGDASSLPLGQMHLPTGNLHLPTGTMYLRTGNMHLPTGDMHLPTGIMHLPTGTTHSPWVPSPAQQTSNPAFTTPPVTGFDSSAIDHLDPSNLFPLQPSQTNLSFTDMLGPYANFNAPITTHASTHSLDPTLAPPIDQALLLDPSWSSNLSFLDTDYDWLCNWPVYNTQPEPSVVDNPQFEGASDFVDFVDSPYTPPQNDWMSSSVDLMFDLGGRTPHSQDTQSHQPGVVDDCIDPALLLNEPSPFA